MPLLGEKKSWKPTKSGFLREHKKGPLKKEISGKCCDSLWKACGVLRFKVMSLLVKNSDAKGVLKHVLIFCARSGEICDLRGTCFVFLFKARGILRFKRAWRLVKNSMKNVCEKCFVFLFKASGNLRFKRKMSKVWPPPYPGTKLPTSMKNVCEKCFGFLFKAYGNLRFMGHFLGGDIAFQERNHRLKPIFLTSARANHRGNLRFKKILTNNPIGPFICSKPGEICDLWVTF